MSDLPAPLVPAGVDLRDFPYMPLDVVRLRDSGLAVHASAEEFRCAVMLWCASWHQVPAASVPDDDAALALLAGFGRSVKEWAKHRKGALRSWIKCSDGRLYHPVVAEKANEAWQAKLRQRYGSECARIKKHNQRHKTELPCPTFEEWMSLGCPQGQALFVPKDNDQCPANVPRETGSKGKGEERERERESKDIPVGARAAPPDRPADAQLYARGRELLGEKSGGIITKLLRANENSIPRVRAILETAAEKDDRMAYVNGVLRARARDPTQDELRLRGEAW